MNTMMKSAFVLISALTLSGQAYAARYMVVFKDKNVFQQTHVQMMAKQMPLASVRIQNGSKYSMPFAQTNDVNVEDSFQHLNTLVVDAADEQALAALQASGAVAFVEKEVFHPAPKPVQGFTRSQAWDYSLAYAVDAKGGVGAKTPWGINAVKAPAVWATGNEGQGSRVLVLDTGIDKEHPALKANFEKAKDFSGSGAGLPYPEADVVGHGTHCAGTIAAAFDADGFAGVAPQAKLLAGKVCSEQGCSNVAVTAGINWGIQEKVDVISMSLGGPFATAAEKRAAEAAELAGITIVAASGNDGQPRVSYPAAFPTVLAVGAINDKVQKTDFSNWGPELDIVAPGAGVVSSVPVGSGRESRVLAGAPGKEVLVKSTSFQGAPDIAQPTSNDLVFAGLGKPEDFQTANVRGKFALVSRGEIAFADKVTNAIAAGAAGVVIFNNAPGLIQGAITQDGSTVAIPVVMIEQVVGEQLKGEVTRGQTARAVIQTMKTDYAAFDGTSMATPHVSGVVALMKSAKRTATPLQIRDTIKATATAMTPNDQNQHGAGLINAEAAVAAIAK
ncbi:MAG: S8 family serine peptidase [Bdellovibrionaceae bacterium]|nr:S8 family serine peptidase [Pseudobdellovibrionaceae bacterium]